VVAQQLPIPFNSYCTSLKTAALSLLFPSHIFLLLFTHFLSQTSLTVIHSFIFMNIIETDRICFLVSTQQLIKFVPKSKRSAEKVFTVSTTSPLIVYKAEHNFERIKLNCSKSKINTLKNDQLSVIWILLVSRKISLECIHMYSLAFYWFD